jgi:hypothetical protein
MYGTSGSPPLRIACKLQFFRCYHAAMRVPLQCLLLAVLAVGINFGQDLAPAPAPAPAFRYSLHGNPGDQDREIISVAPDGSLFVLYSRRDSQWLLERISDWDTNSPREEKLELDGRIPDEKGLADDWNLTVNDTNDLLIARFCFNCINWKELHGSRGGPSPVAAVFQIDLHTFTVTAHSIESDPLLAAGLWRFSPSGQLMVHGLVTPKMVEFERWQGPRDGGTYKAALLTLPDFKPSVSCSYANVFMIPQESRNAFFERKSKVNADCVAVLDAAKVATIEEFSSTIFNYQGFRIARKVNTDSVQRIDPKDRRYDPEDHCSFLDAGQGDRFANYRCELRSLSVVPPGARDYYHADEVFSVADGKRAFVLHLPFNKPVPSHLATSRGQDYLLLLRDSNQLEVYRLPQP